MQMTRESIDAFLAAQKENGTSKDALRQRKDFEVLHKDNYKSNREMLPKEKMGILQETRQVGSKNYLSEGHIPAWKLPTYRESNSGPHESRTTADGGPSIVY